MAVNFDWYNSTSTTTASSGYYQKYGSIAYEEYRRAMMQKMEHEDQVRKERLRTDIPKMRYPVDFKTEYLNAFDDTKKQFMRSVMGDFKDQHDQKDIEEPQTVFHFDPKGIVDKWPEKEN